jgi:hypothetical protein
MDGVTCDRGSFGRFMLVNIVVLRFRPYFSTPTVITFGVSFELLLFLPASQDAGNRIGPWDFLSPF